MGESLAHCETAAAEIRVADRGQALARGRGLVWRPGYLVVRLNWPTLPLLTPTGDRLALIAWRTPRDHPAAIPGQLDPPQGRFPVRWQHPPWFAAPQRPVSLWRLTQLRWAARRHAIYGSISLPSIFANCPPANRRYAPLRGADSSSSPGPWPVWIRPILPSLSSSVKVLPLAPYVNAYAPSPPSTMWAPSPIVERGVFEP